MLFYYQILNIFILIQYIFFLIIYITDLQLLFLFKSSSKLSIKYKIKSNTLKITYKSLL